MASKKLSAIKRAANKIEGAYTRFSENGDILVPGDKYYTKQRQKKANQVPGSRGTTSRSRKDDVDNYVTASRKSGTQSGLTKSTKRKSK